MSSKSCGDHRAISRRRWLQWCSAATAIGAVARPLPAWSGDADAGRPPFEITPISGGPGERGRLYGRRFHGAINAFLEKEIYAVFVGQPSSRKELLAYARGCAGAVREFSPEIDEELSGLAEGAGLAHDEAVLITLHEELYHRSALPPPSHCTAVAAGPPATRGGAAFVGQTWDWMPSVAGLSTMLHWRRGEGPGVLAYAYPGLWVGAGLNSAGLALCWTSADLGKTGLSPRIGVPSYLLLTHFLYQESLDAVIAEARRARHAGWFTFVMADGEGRLVNIEGSPRELAIEESRGALTRVSYGSRQMTKTPAASKVELHPRCQRMADLLEADRGKVDLATMQDYFADPAKGICAGPNTLDLMVFDTVRREAWLSRGRDYGVQWRRFAFSD